MSRMAYVVRYRVGSEKRRDTANKSKFQAPQSKVRIRSRNKRARERLEV